MHVTDDLTEDQIVDLAMSAVAKISLQGMRGATLCSQQETVAMAALIVRLQPVLPAPPLALEKAATPDQTGIATNQLKEKTTDV